MGRRKTKKNKSHGGGGGGGKQQGGGYHAHPLTPADVVAAVAPPADRNKPAALGDEAARVEGPASPPVAAQSSPQPRPGPSGSGQRSTGSKASKRAQIQGELSSLEAQLAAVEDLQARMAAKLSSVDSNISSMQDGLPPQAAGPACGVAGGSMEDTERKGHLVLGLEQKSEKEKTPQKQVEPQKQQQQQQQQPGDQARGSQDKAPSGKSKKNKKKAKQAKDLKQEENLREAHQPKEKVGKTVCHVKMDPSVNDTSKEGLNQKLKEEAVIKPDVSKEPPWQPPKAESADNICNVTFDPPVNKDILKEEVNKKLKEEVAVDIDLQQTWVPENTCREAPAVVVPLAPCDVVEVADVEAWDGHCQTEASSWEELGPSQTEASSWEELCVEPPIENDPKEAKVKPSEQQEERVGADVKEEAAEAHLPPTDKETACELLSQEILSEKLLIEKPEDCSLAVAHYLAAEYSKVMAAAVACRAEDEYVLLSEEKVSRSASSPTTPTSPCLMSYADAVKTTLQVEYDKQQQQQTAEEAESTYRSLVETGEEKQEEEEDQQLKQRADNEQLISVMHFLRNEYEPWLRRMEAEDGEVAYHEAMARGKVVSCPAAQSATSEQSPSERQQCCLTPDLTPPAVSRVSVPAEVAQVAAAAHDDDDDEEEEEEEEPAEVSVEEAPSVSYSAAVNEALAADHRQVELLAVCLKAEMEYEEYQARISPSNSLNNSASDSPSDSPSDSLSDLKKKPSELLMRSDVLLPDKREEKEIALYLQEDCQRLQNYQHALRMEEATVIRGKLETTTTLPEDPPPCCPDVMKREVVCAAEVLEAAAMEVEYEGAETDFLRQREQRQPRPWRWVRADTAPAHIDVPETVPEPESDPEPEPEEEGEEGGRSPPPMANVARATVGVLTDLAGLVFQCRDASTITDQEEPPPAQYVAPVRHTQPGVLGPETPRSHMLEHYVKTLEDEIAEQRRLLIEQKKVTDQLENSISDYKAQGTEAKIIAAEYKSRCEELERNLDTARCMLNTLEGQVDTTRSISSGIDYMLEAKLSSRRALEAEAKVEELETKLILSKAEVQKALDKLSDQNQHVDLMPVAVHQQQMQKVEGRCHELQLKVAQLESELTKLRKVRDVWGSCQQGGAGMQPDDSNVSYQPLGQSAVPTGHLYDLPASIITKPSTCPMELSSLAGVDLPPVSGVDLPPCLSGLMLGHPPVSPIPAASPPQPPADCAAVTPGLMPSLAELPHKAPPVVAPLAIQEDMDSDDDVSWSSASEQLRDGSSPSSQSRSSLRSNKACLPSSPLLGHHPEHHHLHHHHHCGSSSSSSSSGGGGGGGSGGGSGSLQSADQANNNNQGHQHHHHQHHHHQHHHQHQEPVDENSASPKPKGNKRRHRPKKYQK